MRAALIVAALALAGCATVTPEQEQDAAITCLHEARQAVVDNAAPDRSRLILAGGALTPDEVQRLRNLAGACQSRIALGREHQNAAANISALNAVGAVAAAIVGIAILASPPPPAYIVVVPGRRW